MIRRSSALRLFPVALAAAPFLWPSHAEGQEPATEEASPKKENEEAVREGEETASAQEAKRKAKRRDLSDRIKSVQRKVFLKKQRVELYPHFALDLNDPFFQHFIAGGSLAFHVADSFAIEARGGGVFASVKQGAIKLVRAEAGALLENPPEFKYHGDLDVSWSPLYGKISLLGEGILHFDVYVTAGGGIFGTDAGIAPAANIGIGQRYFITDWLVARFELRDYMFVEDRAHVSDIQNLLVLGFSLSGFFPTSFSYEGR